jgi:hypothetical protein
MISPRAGQVLIFTRHSLAGPKASALQKLARYLEGDEAQKAFSEELERMPVTTGLLQLWKNDPARAAILSQWEHAADLPRTRALAYLWPAVRRGIDLFVFGGRPLAEAIREMNAIASKGPKR